LAEYGNLASPTLPQTHVQPALHRSDTKISLGLNAWIFFPDVGSQTSASESYPFQFISKK
jgi:hypothetical protein